MPSNARFPNDVDWAIFGDLIPDEITAAEIEKWQTGQYRLVATTPANDMNALALHKRLQEKYCEILHLQRSAYRGEQLIGINLYFATKPKT